MKDNIQILISESVELLKEMVAIPSVSFSEADVCTLISSWLTEKGVEHRRDGNNLIAEHISNPDSPTLMLCAHIDTVAASNEYSFDPHKPDYIKAAETISSYIAEGKIPEAPCSQATPENIVAGLGSNDDGASVVSMIAVFRYFKSMTVSPNIMLVLSCEEERSGINGMTGLWHRIKDKVDYAIVGEPTGMKAATAERGLLVIDASAHGISGHAARNEGLNAIHIALEDIERLRTHEFTKISPRMGKVNLNVTQINAGTAHNVIPDLCTFVIDIRPTEQYSNEEILKELQGICRSELKARNLSNLSSATKEGSILQDTADRLGIDTFSSPTTSDWMRIDCDAIKMGPGNSSRSHKKDEFVFVKEIEDGIKTYIEFIENL
ncbi:MAG: M20/M25/M40 family metallo-hydrolase [Bacteroidales bacterium]|nr:M20/M25/M40 family metallo-hydrolase [Bacteroidales bacterium]